MLPPVHLPWKYYHKKKIEEMLTGTRSGYSQDSQVVCGWKSIIKPQKSTVKTCAAVTIATFREGYGLLPESIVWWQERQWFKNVPKELFHKIVCSAFSGRLRCPAHPGLHFPVQTEPRPLFTPLSLSLIFWETCISFLRLATALPFRHSLLEGWTLMH